MAKRMKYFEDKNEDNNILSIFETKLLGDIERFNKDLLDNVVSRSPFLSMSFTHLWINTEEWIMKKHKIISEFAWKYLRRGLILSTYNREIFDKIQNRKKSSYLGLWMGPSGVQLYVALMEYRGMDYEET